MKTANDNIGTILAPVATARITRDKALYAEDTGMVDVSAVCKGCLAPLRPEAKMVRKIKFTRI